MMDAHPGKDARFSLWVKRFSDLTLARPWVTLLLALATGALALYVSSFLRVDTRFSSLIPDDAPELLELNELQDKAGGTTELVIAVEGADPPRKMAFARDVVSRLRSKPWIHRADVEFPIDFFLDRRLLLLSARQLDELREAVEEELERARARANPLYVDLEGPGRGPKHWAEVDRTSSFGGHDLLKRTYESQDGRYLFVRVTPLGTSYDMGGGKALLAGIKAVVQEAGPERSGVRIRYAGGLLINQEQNDRMTQDMARASVIALVLILLLMTLYVRRVTAPIVIAVPLTLGVTVALAITELVIGQLNLVSGFLVSALFGLGVEYEIHLYLRYLELLDGGCDRRDAMREAISKTLRGCITSALTTAAAAFSMAISSFRGYREYGLILGMGVLVALVVTFAVLPPLAVLLDRRGRRVTRGDRAAPPRQLPRWLAWHMVGVGAALLIFSLAIAPRVRWYNDFKRLRGVSENVEFSHYVGDLLGGDLTPAAILVNDLQQARTVEDYLRERARRPDSWVKFHLSLASMVPVEAEKKLGRVREIERALRAVPAERLRPEDRRRVADALALTRARPWTVDQIPRAIRSQFQTLDGRGQFIVVWPRFKTDVDRDIMAWGAELTRIRSELRGRGIPVKIMDESRVSARVLTEMRAESPVVLTSAALVVLLALGLDLRRPKEVALIAGPLAAGLTWMLGLMVLWEIDFNVFNQAVLATVIGSTVDNAVHIRHRYRDEGPGSLVQVVRTSGSAGFLATATNIFGFGAAVYAHHLGIRSLGWLAIIGLASTFVATNVLYPAMLRLLEPSNGAR